MRTIDDRYRNDPGFHQLVSITGQIIRCGQFTLSETREAAMLAQMHVKLDMTRKTAFSPDLMNEIEFRTGIKFEPEEPNPTMRRK